MEGCLAGTACALGGCSAGLLGLRRPAPRVQESAIAAAGHRFVRLPDGRLLEYAVAGDPGGVPVYFQHGYCSSCMLSASWDAIARRCGARLIAASMPGFGLSDSYPLGRERSLVEWPADVLALLQQEGVARVHLLGHSAGCVHVAALAHGLPSGMVGNVCFGAPTCPDDVPGSHAGIARTTLVVKKLMGKPYVGDLIAYALSKMSSMQRAGIAPDAKAALQRMRVELPTTFEEIIANFDHASSCTYRGFTDNACTVLRPLPFHLQDLAALTEAGGSVAITSSDDDTTNPPAMQRWFQSQVPGSNLMKFESGWGHLHFFVPANFERTLRFLVTGRDPLQDDGVRLPSLLGAVGAEKPQKL